MIITIARECGCYGDLIGEKLGEKLGIPVCTYWDAIDLIETEHPLYVGRGGNMGDRAVNFAVQNSDFLLCIGTRLNIYQVGWHVDKWAREAFTVVVDIDPIELKKKIIGGIHVCISEDDELCVRVIRSKDRNYIYTYLSDESFSSMIIRGYSVKDAACDILEAYHEYVNNMCFK